MATENFWPSIFVEAIRVYDSTAHYYPIDKSIAQLEYYLTKITKETYIRKNSLNRHIYSTSVIFFFWRITQYFQVQAYNLSWRQTRPYRRNLVRRSTELTRLANISHLGFKSYRKALSEPELIKLSEFISLLLPKNISNFTKKNKTVHCSHKMPSCNKHDPSNCNSLDIFKTIANHTPCPYACPGRYWGAPDWNEELNFEENSRAISRSLKSFLYVGKYWKFDGFAVVLPAYYSLSIEELSKTLHRFLKYLLMFDPNSACDLESISDNKDWSFTCFGESMFVTSFGTCYKKDNPRYTFGIEKTVFFLQPDYTLRSLSALNGEAESKTRKKIKNIFTEQNMPYTNCISPNEAQRYIRSHTAGKKVVEWWKHT